MQIGLEQVLQLQRQDAAAIKKRKTISLIIIIAIFCFMMCLRTTCIGFVSPFQVISNLFALIQINISHVLHLPFYDQRLEVIEGHPYYLETISRLSGLIVAMSLGAVLAVAGAVYQNVFRNPIAVPSMLGISSGVDFASMIMVLVYSTAAATMLFQRYILSYIISILLLLFILLTGRLMGNKKNSVTDMLLSGTIVVRLLSNALNSIQDYRLTDDERLTYQQMSLFGSGVQEGTAFIALLGAIFIGLLILGLMRFSLNVISFEDEDSGCMGVRPGVLRLVSLVASTILMTAAIIHLGNVSMLSLLVPHVSRYIFGANFKEVFFSCMVYGGAFMLICRGITYLFSFNEYLMVISSGTIINIVSAPIMIFLLIKQKRGWE